MYLIFDGICDDFISIHGFFVGGGPSGREGIRVLEEKIFNAVELGREDRTLLRDWVTECLTRGLTASFAMMRSSSKVLRKETHFAKNHVCLCLQPLLLNNATLKVAKCSIHVF